MLSLSADTKERKRKRDDNREDKPNYNVDLLQDQTLVPRCWSKRQRTLGRLINKLPSH
jgi:hypothetical protein